MLTSKAIIFNGILQRSITNYHPQISPNSDRKLPQKIPKYLKHIIYSNDVTTIKRQSILYREIKAYQKITLGIVHHAYLINVTLENRQGLELVPVAIFLNGIFISSDDAQRFYKWLTINH